MVEERLYTCLVEFVVHDVAVLQVMVKLALHSWSQNMLKPSSDQQADSVLTLCWLSCLEA